MFPFKGPWSKVGFLAVFCFSIAATVSLAPRANAQLNTTDPNVWVPNGSVYAVATTGTKAYLGGSFGHVGPSVEHGFPATRATGDAVATFPKVNNEIYAVVSDGAGGWYIGGNFTYVGGVAAQRLAHIKSDGTTDTGFVASANAAVYSLKLYNGKLYVGGNFTAINSVMREYLAAVNPTTGALDSWNPNSNQMVASMDATGTTLYVSGYFTNIGGAARSRLAALDLATASATAWDPSASDVVEVVRLSADGTKLYAGGAFTTIGGDSRSHIAEIDLATASATAWNPDANSNVKTIAQSGNNLYVGGNFTAIGGDTRNHIANIDLVSASATAWDPNANSTVNDLAVYGSVIYVAGDFDTIGGASRYFVAALDATTGNALSSWSKKLDSSANVLALSSDASQVYVGGRFVTYGGEERFGLAEIDLTTGRMTSWNPEPDGDVRSLKISPDGSTLYVGGTFGHLGLATRNFLGAYDLNTMTLKSWDPSPDSYVHAINTDKNGLVYIGGEFVTVGVDARNHIAAIDPVSASATAWDPSSTYSVRSLAVSNDASTVFYGNSGTFCRPFFPPRCTYYGKVASIKASDGTQNWLKSADNNVYAIALSPDEQRLYVGGAFSSYDSGLNGYLVGVLPADGSVDGTFSPITNGIINSILPDPTGTYVFVGGGFTRFGATTVNRLAALRASDYSLSDWNPNVEGGYVYSLAADANFSRFVSGGEYQYVGNAAKPSFSSFLSPSVRFDASSINVAENAGTVNLGMTLSQVSPLDVVVDFRISGTAVSGTDYLPPARVTIPAGSLTANAVLRILDDAQAQTGENVVASLSPYLTQTGSPQTYTVNVSDNDSQSSGGGGGGRFYGLLEASPVGLKPAGKLGVIINQDAATALSRAVFLKLTAGSDVARVTISNWPDFRDGSTETYSENKIWDLCANNRLEIVPDAQCAAGTKTVYVKFLSKSGVASDVYSDSIQYQPQYTPAKPMSAITKPAGKLKPASIKFTRDLRTGDKGEDVRALQKFLNANGFLVAKSGPGSPGNETTLFGAGTRAAVRLYQEAYAKNILAPQGLKRGNGLFGPSTRNFTNSIK